MKLVYLVATLFMVSCVVNLSMGARVMRQEDDDEEDADGDSDSDDEDEREWASVEIGDYEIQIESEYEAPEGSDSSRLSSSEHWKLKNGEDLVVRMENEYKIRVGGEDVERESELRFKLRGSGCYSTADGADPVEDDETSFKSFDGAWDAFDCDYQEDIGKLDCSTSGTVDGCTVTFLLHMASQPTEVEDGVFVDGRSMKFDIQSTNCTCAEGEKLGYEVDLRSYVAVEGDDDDDDDDDEDEDIDDDEDDEDEDDEEEISSEDADDEEAAVSLAPRFSWLGHAERLAGCAGEPIAVRRSGLIEDPTDPGDDDEEDEEDDEEKVTRRIIFVMDAPANSTCGGHLWDPFLSFGSRQGAEAEPFNYIFYAAVAGGVALVGLVAGVFWRKGGSPSIESDSESKVAL